MTCFQYNFMTQFEIFNFNSAGFYNQSNKWMQEDPGSIPTFLEALISLLSDNGLKALFL